MQSRKLNCSIEPGCLIAVTELMSPLIELKGSTWNRSPIFIRVFDRYSIEVLHWDCKNFACNELQCNGSGSRMYRPLYIIDSYSLNVHRELIILSMAVVLLWGCRANSHYQGRRPGRSILTWIMSVIWMSSTRENEVIEIRVSTAKKRESQILFRS